MSIMTAIGVIAAVIGTVYTARTYHLTRQGLKVEKPDVKPRRPIWTIVTVIALVALVWLVIGIHYFSITSPDLQADVEGIVGGPSPTNSNDTVAAIKLNIANIGEKQTVIKEWQVTVSAAGLGAEGQILEIPAKVVFSDPKKIIPGMQDFITATSDDDLSIASDPIQVGDMDTGALYVEFPNLDTRGAVEFTITFEDVFSNKYSVTSDIDGRQLQATVTIPSTAPPKIAAPAPPTSKKN